MLPFSRDHPHVRSPQGVMTCEEIRFWIRRFLEEGMPRRPLARFLGAYDAGSLKAKLKNSWIYPAEQIRFSRQLRKLISGEIVFEKNKRNSFDAVLAKNPKPVPPALRFDLASGRLGYVVQGPQSPGRQLKFSIVGVPSGWV